MKKTFIISMLAVVFCLYSSALWAAEFNPYASIRFQTGYYDVDENFPGGPGADGTIGNAGDDDSGLLFTVMADSRFGSNVKADQLSGNIELGLKNSSRNGNSVNDIYLRKAYGSWQEGEFNFLIGKTFTPATFLGYSRMNADIGNQGDDDNFSSGIPHINRQAQVRISYKGFEIAGIEQNKKVNTDNTDVDFYMPRMELAYQAKVGPHLSFRPIFGYQVYKVSEKGGKNTEKIRSFVAGLGIKFDTPTFFSRLATSYAQNGQNYGLQCNAITNFYSASYLADKEVEDSDLWQGVFVLGYQAGQIARWEGGISYLKSDGYDSLRGEGDQESWVFYLQTRVALARNIELIPEVGYVKVGDEKFDSGRTIDRGDMKYANLGVKLTF